MMTMEKKIRYWSIQEKDGTIWGQWTRELRIDVTRDLVRYYGEEHLNSMKKTMGLKLVEVEVKRVDHE